MCGNQTVTNLLLDISVHFPSDSKHWFKYLTFRPGVPFDKCERSRCEEQSLLVKVDDHQHGWIAGSRDSALTEPPIEKVFDEIMGEGPFDDDEQESHWWQQLPLVPAVTVVLLRQQSRRRWKPKALVKCLPAFPSSRKFITSLGGNGLMVSRC